MGSKNVTSKTETITPKKAQLYLESNTHNRHLREKTVEYYAQLMRNGEWKLNGKTIVISNDGILLDGQHRLHACVRAGSSFRTVVVRGPEDEVFGTIDGGINRTAGDVVGREGYAHANRKAAIARVLLALLDADEHPDEVKPQLKTKRSPLHILDYVIDNDDLLTEACNVIRQDDGPNICKPPALFGAMYAYLALKNHKKAKEFFEQITSGANIGRDDPAARLRRTLIGALNMTGVKRKKTWLMAIVIKAWNAFLRGKSVGNLKFSDSEKWPKTRARK
jgi:hypothetical protein